MEVAVNKGELFSMIKDAVREVLKEETLTLLFRGSPYASKAEMDDIRKRYGKPRRRRDVAYSETLDI